jgi:hypothetical protein
MAPVPELGLPLESADTLRTDQTIKETEEMHLIVKDGKQSFD